MLLGDYTYNLSSRFRKNKFVRCQYWVNVNGQFVPSCICLMTSTIDPYFNNARYMYCTDCGEIVDLEFPMYNHIFCEDCLEKHPYVEEMRTRIKNTLILIGKNYLEPDEKDLRNCFIDLVEEGKILGLNFDSAFDMIENGTLTIKFMIEKINMMVSD